MFEKIWEMALKLISLSEKTDKNIEDIKEIQREIRDIYIKT